MTNAVPINTSSSETTSGADVPEELPTTICGHQPYYTKDYCRNCYERELRRRNTDYAERQRENSRKWAAAHREWKRQADREYRKLKGTPEYNEIRKLKVYGLTKDDYQQMLENQRGRCAICGKEPIRRKLAVDHDHETGLIRGLLCFRCNFGLGWFQDDISRLRRAVSHLAGNNACLMKRVPDTRRRRHWTNFRRIHVGFPQ